MIILFAETWLSEIDCELIKQSKNMMSYSHADVGIGKERGILIFIDRKISTYVTILNIQRKMRYVKN